MSGRYTLEELLAVDLAHTIEDGEVGFTRPAHRPRPAHHLHHLHPDGRHGAGQRTHAPNLTILLSGVYFNPDVAKLHTLPESEYEQVLVDLPSEAQMPGWPEQWHHRGGDISFGFGSGVQVDREGNLNSTCIGNVRHPKVELVGPIFLPEHFSCFGREYIMMPNHERRSFVEKVDYISGVGWPGGAEGRRKLGFTRRGAEIHLHAEMHLLLRRGGDHPPQIDPSGRLQTGRHRQHRLFHPQHRGRHPHDARTDRRGAAHPARAGGPQRHLPREVLTLPRQAAGSFLPAPVLYGKSPKIWYN